MRVVRRGTSFVTVMGTLLAMLVVPVVLPPGGVPGGPRAAEAVVLPPNLIETVAGGGVGDGDAARAVSVRPDAVAVNAGDLLIVDSYASRVRKVNALGVISTFAGNGTRGSGGNLGAAHEAQLSSPTGIAVSATGDVYIADSDNNLVRRVNSAGR